MGTEQPLVHIKLDAEEVRAALVQAWLDKFDASPSPRTITLLLAHIALETGMAECRNWNLGNCKAQVNGPVDWCIFDTWEMIDGRHVDMKCAFRSFPDLPSGAIFYVDLLFHQFNRAWPAVREGDPGMFAVLLKEQRYYTAPLEDYAAGMRARFAFYWTHLAQSLLCGAGYDVTVDGLLGPKTQAALSSFQGDANIPISGKIDDATISALQSAQADRYVDSELVDPRVAS